ncbi:MAG: molybdate ABC transporter substrate-binding protein, partial [Bacteroidales bacterium]|nr:molybdate ABC transporter substrate-binding protein [Bacteroidales bacterium]
MNVKNILGVLMLSIIASSILIYSCKLNEDIVDNQNYKPSDESTIMVFAGASLTDVLNEIIDSFEVNYPVKIQTNVASSGTLARQISQGEIPDLYLSSNKKWLNYVDSLGFLKSEFNTVIAQNNLVLIAPVKSSINPFAINNKTNLASLLKEERLSIGDPQHVPAGMYAKQSLEHYGCFSQVQHKVLKVKDVRSALMMVELEETPLGIVYKTDAL